MALEKGLDGVLEAQSLEVYYLKSHFTFIQPQLMEFVYLFLFLPVKSMICEFINSCGNTLTLLSASSHSIYLPLLSLNVSVVTSVSLEGFH